MKNDIQLPKNNIKSLRAGPLSEYIDDFILFLDEKGFSKKYIPRRLGLINDLGKWIIDNNINIKEFNKKLINEFINKKKVVLLLWINTLTEQH